MYSGDDYSHHPWQGHAFKRTTEEISESLAAASSTVLGDIPYCA